MEGEIDSESHWTESHISQPAAPKEELLCYASPVNVSADQNESGQPVEGLMAGDEGYETPEEASPS